MTRSALIASDAARHRRFACCALLIALGGLTAIAALQSYGTALELAIVASGTGIGAVLTAYVCPRVSRLGRPLGLALGILGAFPRPRARVPFAGSWAACSRAAGACCSCGRLSAR